MNLESLKYFLELANIEFEPGLSANEFDLIEKKYHFSFPPDLKEFLAYSLPVSDQFPNWRSGSTNQLRSILAWPFEGLCIDIKDNSFWHPEWGVRPKNLDDAYETARIAVQQAPKLIPIYSHRYMPATPCESGNPVISVYQTDIIHYGTDLENYLIHEFHMNHQDGENIFVDKIASTGFRKIEFWDDIIYA